MEVCLGIMSDLVKRLKITQKVHIRTQELQFILKETKITYDDVILEIGSGEGIQGHILMKKSKLVILSDISFRRFLKYKRPIFILCDAQYLPFREDTFSVVYVSNVLEHIKNRHQALYEIKRVLKNDGKLILVAPTSFWKILNILSYYINMLLYSFGLMLSCVLRDAKGNSKGLDGKEKRTFVTYLRYLLPQVHGEYNNNIEEYHAYKDYMWQKLVESAGFNSIKKESIYIRNPRFFLLIPYYSNKKYKLASALLLVFRAKKVSCTTIGRVSSR